MHCESHKLCKIENAKNVVNKKHGSAITIGLLFGIRVFIVTATDGLPYVTIYLAQIRNQKFSIHPLLKRKFLSTERRRNRKTKEATMIIKNSRSPAWRVKESPQPKPRNKKGVDRLAQAMVKEIKKNRHARDLPDLPEHIKSDPVWKKIKKNKSTAGAVNVLASLGGTVRELEYVLQKMYRLDRSLFLPKGWGNFLNNDNGKTKRGAIKAHLDYPAGTRPSNRPARGFVFECTQPLEDLRNDDYFHVIGTWEGSPDQGKLFPNIAIVEKEVEKEIDKILEKLVTKSKIKNYEKWKREYKDRVIDSIRPQRSRNLPPGITQPPGFETHLICYLFNLLKEKEPHCEWSYRSYVADSRKSADIVFIQPVSEKLCEIWVEVGMYVGDTFKKYGKDFEKVTKVVDQCPWCVGVLVHLESEPRGTVFELFNSFKDEKSKKYSLNIRKIGDENSIHIVRLIVRQKQ